MLKGCITLYSAAGYTEIRWFTDGYTEIGWFTDGFSGTCANGWEKYSWESWLVVDGIKEKQVLDQ